MRKVNDIPDACYADASPVQDGWFACGSSAETGLPDALLAYGLVALFDENLPHDGLCDLDEFAFDGLGLFVYGQDALHGFAVEHAEFGPAPTAQAAQAAADNTPFLSAGP